MNPKLSPSALRVQTALQDRGIPLQVVELPDSTRTAVEAAQAIGCLVGQIAKSLVFKGKHTSQPILVIASGPNRVNEQTIAKWVGEPIEKPDAAFVRLETGFSIGGVPPIGHQKTLVPLIDEDLLEYKAIWAAAGTPHAVFALRPTDLIKITGGRVISIH